MNTRQAHVERGADRAEAWLARLQSPECTIAEREAFERWRASDAEHASAYARAERVHRRAADLVSDPVIAAAARTARQHAALRRGPHRRVLRRAALLATAAVLLLAVFVGVWRFSGPGQVLVQQYATKTGTQRTVQLSDGTQVLLDTNSAISVRYDDNEREVTLDRGRAQFVVVHETRRPFVVHAIDGTIHDIGTRFQVRMDADNVIVTLLDGAVSISVSGNGSSGTHSSTLAPGQQISFDRSGRLGAKHAIDLDVARGWTHGDLIFKNRSLADLLAEMNRYSQTKLHLGDPSLRKIPISGVFHAGDQLSLVQALERGWSLRAQTVSAHEIVLYPAHR